MEIFLLRNVNFKINKNRSPFYSLIIKFLPYFFTLQLSTIHKSFTLALNWISTTLHLTLTNTTNCWVDRQMPNFTAMVAGMIRRG